MSEHRRPDDDELADYLLGEGGEDRRRELEQRLNADPEARAEADTLGGIADDLGRLPPEAWPTADPAPRRSRWVPRPVVAALAGAAVVVAVVAGVALSTGGDDEPAPGELRLTAIGGQAGSGRAGFASDGDRRQLRVSVTDVAPSRPGEFYELWLLGRGGRLVSLGSFTVGESGRRTMELPVPANARGYGSIDVSREPDDGDPAHSKRSVLRGPAA